MLEEANKPRSAVNWGACLTAAAVATSLVGATVARADDDDHWKKRRRHHHSPPYYVVAPPVLRPATDRLCTPARRLLPRANGLHAGLAGLRLAGRQPESRRHPAAAPGRDHGSATRHRPLSSQGT